MGVGIECGQTPEEENRMKKRISMIAPGAALLLAGFMLAQPRPKENVSAARHPNLAAAQRLCEQAFQKVVAAQQANEFDLGGHAERARKLLDQVNNELKLAAEQSNRNKR
jgi:hypothetical protein